MNRFPGLGFLCVGAIVGAPLLGVWWEGRSLGPLFRFPLRTTPGVHAPFSWPVFLIYSGIGVAVVAMLVMAARRSQPSVRQIVARPSRPLPKWAWAGMAGLVFFWAMAWSRWQWAAGCRPFAFTPLWLSYIVVINGRMVHRSGRAPLTDHPGFLAALFPISSLFWWYFEYLNQFVQNWSYSGADFGSVAYSVHASAAFSTVLPAVYSTQSWIMGSQWFRCRFHGITPIRVRWPKTGAVLALTAALVVLAIMPIYPDRVFSMIWVAPPAMVIGLQVLAGRSHVFETLAAGDWRPVVSWALAALVCGLFWEMWNYFSLARWTYTVPHVQRFHLFEMPILGYLGYLPFGVACMVVVAMAAPDPTTITSA